MRDSDEMTSDPVWLRVLEVAVSALWPLIALVALLLFYRPLRAKLPALTAFKAGNVEARFPEEMREAEPTGVAVMEADRRGAIGRAQQAKAFCEGKRILWVDDDPSAIRRMAALMHELLGVHIDHVVNTDEALQLLRRDDRYALVITDMTRGGEQDAGVKFIADMRNEHLARPTIIYLAALDPSRGIPAGAFGLTNRPDELLHLVIDVCERSRWR